MIRIIVLLVVGYLVYRALRNWMFPGAPGDGRVDRKAAGEIDDVMLKDPYCGTYFPSRDGIRTKLNGKEFVFCSEACKQKFIAEHPDDSTR